MRKQISGIVVVLLVWSLGACGQPGGDAPGGRLIFAETFEYWTAPTLLAGALELYEAAGVDVEVVKFQSGLLAKNAVLSGSADLGLVATTPVAIAGFQDEPLVIIATYFRSDDVIKLVRRGGAPERPSAEELATLRIGYVPGTISEIALGRLLRSAGVRRDSVRTAALRPTELVPALHRGDIDAFVAWEPLGIIARRELGERVTVVGDLGLYQVELHLVTRPEVVRGHRDALVRFVTAVEMAVDSLAASPDRMRREVERLLDFADGELAGEWSSLEFMLDLDPAGLVAQLEEEGRWARQAGYATGAAPDYREYVDTAVVAELRQAASLSR